MLNIQAIQALYELARIPIQIIEKETIIYSFEKKAFSPNPALYIMKEAVSSSHKICYTFTPEYYYCGFVRIQDSDMYGVVGPASTFEHDRKRGNALLSAIGQPSSRLVEFLGWLDIIPETDGERFKGMLKMLSFIIDGTCDAEPVNIQYATNISETSDSHHKLLFLEHYESKFEQELLSCVEYGRVDMVKQMMHKMINSHPMSLPKRAKDALRAQKNSHIFATGIISRAAIRGGLSHDVAHNLSDYYLIKIENLNHPQTLTAAFCQMVADYTQRVADFRYALTHSPLSLKVSKLVISYIYEKITPTMLSEMLDMDVSYLCRRFKNDTGKTITTYVNEVKIAEAKRLLKNTSVSVYDISFKLGFSAQNYFQSVFKKIVGITPTEYRNKDLNLNISSNKTI